MNAQQVVEKILAEAQAEAAKIRQEGQGRVEAEEARVQAELEQFRRDTESQAEQAAAETKAQILASARMDGRKEYLAAKVRLLDEVFERARRKVQSLPDKEYRELMKSLLLRTVETGDEKVAVGRNEQRLDQNLVREVNEKLGPKGKLQLADERADIEAGFILERGKIRINGSIDVLIGQAREELALELARVLFGDQSGRPAK